MYHKTNCPEHGFYKSTNKYQDGCSDCFKLALDELEEWKKLRIEANSEIVNLKYENEKLKKYLGDKIIRIILDKK